MDECYFKTEYRCDSYKNILEYARSYKWPSERRKDRGFQSIKFPSTLMDNDPILKYLNNNAVECLITRLNPRVFFKVHVDSRRNCGLHLCLHHDHSHTFFLMEKEYASSKFVEPIYEPGYYYLLDVTKPHGVINCSEEFRYNGFFTLNSEKNINETKELLGEVIGNDVLKDIDND